MNQISTDTINSIKTIAADVAKQVKDAAEKGTKLPASQWAKRDHYEKNATATLRDLLAAGYVVSGVGKPTVSKAGEVGVNFKISAPQMGLAEKVKTYVTAQMNAKAKRAALRAAKQTPAAAPVVAMNPGAAAVAALAQLQKAA